MTDQNKSMFNEVVEKSNAGRGRGPPMITDLISNIDRKSIVVCPVAKTSTLSDGTRVTRKREMRGEETSDE